MSTENETTSPAAGDDKTGNNAGSNQRSGNKNKNKQKKQNHQHNTAGSSFKGAIPELGAITIGDTPSQTNAYFVKVDRAIRNQIGREMHELSLKSLEGGELAKPEEYQAKMVDGSFENEMEKMKYEINYKENLKIEGLVKKELFQIFHIYIGQCSDQVKASLKEHADYEEMVTSKNVFLLRPMLKNLTVGFNETKPPIKVLLESLREYMMIRQMKGESTDDYLKRFKNLMKTVHELIGGKADDPSIFGYMSLLEKYCKENNLGDSKSLDTADQLKYLKVQHGRMEAMHFILGADKERFGGMIQEFDRSFLSGVDNYPTDLQKAYTLLRHWHGNNSKKKKSVNDTELGVSFNAVGDQDDGGGDDTATRAERKKCDRCGRYHRGQCTATTHVNGTTLHISGSVKEMESGEDEDHWEGSEEAEVFF